MNKLNIVCLSGKARHGKDTTAQILSDKLTRMGYNVLLTHYADLLKWMCEEYFNWDGKKDQAGRDLLQHVGTDVVRAKDPNFWVDWIVHILKLFPNTWDYVIIADSRFPNEIERLRDALDANIYHVRVFRPNCDSGLTAEQQTHASERALDDYPYDRLLLNTSLEELSRQVTTLIAECLTV